MSALAIDAGWHRETPNTPIRTIVLNLGTGKGSVRTPPTGAVAGKITDKHTGAPVAMVTVTDGIRSGMTDAKGAYKIIFPAGTYTITASKKDYLFGLQQAKATSGGRTVVDFQLGP